MNTSAPGRMPSEAAINWKWAIRCGESLQMTANWRSGKRAWKWAKARTIPSMFFRQSSPPMEMA